MHRKWNKFYRQKGRFYLLPHEDFKKAINIFKQKKLKKILDLGCGTGRHLIELAENNFEVTGLDFSPIAGNIAEKWLHQKGLKGKVYIGDYKKDLSNFPDNYFNACISVNSLQYIDSKKTILGILSDLNRITKKQGKFFLVLPSETSLIIQPNVYQKFYKKDELKEILENFWDIHELYKDKNQSWTVFATCKSD